MYLGERIPLLEVKNLTVNFPTNDSARKKNVLHQVSFKLFPAQRLGIVGESGSGKSVLALAIMALIRDIGAEIANGEIQFKSADLLQANEKQLCHIRGRLMSLIVQEPANALNPVLTIEKQLSEILRIHYPLNSGLANREQLIDILLNMQFKDPVTLLKRYPFELSGGMCQRILIAMALLTNAELIIADEPTTALDMTTQAEIIALMRGMMDDGITMPSQQKSMIFISHDLNVIADMCTDILVLYGGQVMECCRANTFFREARHPYAQSLLQARPQFFKGRFPTIARELSDQCAGLSQGCAFARRCRQAMPVCHIKIPPIVTLQPHHTVGCWRYQV